MRGIRKLLFLVVVFLLSTNLVFAQSDKNLVNIYIFHSDTCPHCKEEIKFLESINDSNIKSGRENYKENMRLLISSLLDHHIIPVILEIPYYDIFYTFWRRSPISMFRSIRSMLWTQSAINCIDSYSNAYNELITEQHWQDVIITIRRVCWNPKG